MRERERERVGERMWSESEEVEGVMEKERQWVERENMGSEVERTLRL